jgi:hypothetical protein
MKKVLTDIFEVNSVAKTLALCVFTLGAYLIYKLYHFSTQINQQTELKISTAFIATSIVLFTL